MRALGGARREDRQASHPPREARGARWAARAHRYLRVFTVVRPTLRTLCDHWFQKSPGDILSVPAIAKRPTAPHVADSVARGLRESKPCARTATCGWTR